MDDVIQMLIFDYGCKEFLSVNKEFNNCTVQYIHCEIAKDANKIIELLPELRHYSYYKKHGKRKFSEIILSAEKNIRLKYLQKKRYVNYVYDRTVDPFTFIFPIFTDVILESCYDQGKQTYFSGISFIPNEYEKYIEFFQKIKNKCKCIQRLKIVLNLVDDDGINFHRFIFECYKHKNCVVHPKYLDCYYESF